MTRNADIGLFTNPFLVFIAFFVWIGAANESRMVQMKSALSGIPVSRAMLTNYEVITPNEPLANAVQHILSGSQQDFPVVQDGKVVGVLTKGNIFSGLNTYGDQARVEQVMEKDFVTADSHQMLETAFANLQDCGCHTLPILHDNQLVGLVTMDNIGEFIRIQSTLRTPA